MQIEGTRKAFETMLQERGIYKRLGVDTSTVSNWKTYLREDRSISLDKMEEMLTRAGATVAREKVWDLILGKDQSTAVAYSDFILRLHTVAPGGSIDVDFSTGMSLVEVVQAIHNYARKIHCTINSTDLNQSTVNFEFKPI